MPDRVILDTCCGSRMMWFDHNNPAAIFGDKRNAEIIVNDFSHNLPGGKRVIYIAPDLVLDFCNLPFPDSHFKMVVFDPPHLTRAGKNSWIGAKYGCLGPDWRGDIAQGFRECFRVLEEYGVLIFKWSDVHVKIREILPLSPHMPLFGNTSGKKAGTHWMIFMKVSGEASHV